MTKTKSSVHFLDSGYALCEHREPQVGTQDKQRVTCVSCKRLLKEANAKS